MKVTVRAPCKATEDPEKVLAAATMWFPGTVSSGPTEICVEHDDLTALRARVWELRIIDTFRAQVQKGAYADGRATKFYLSKQAAASGVVSFPASKHALGDVGVDVVLEPGDRWADIEALAWWLAPETKDGQIVGPT